jgi:hypothetical protein
MAIYTNTPDTLSPGPLPRSPHLLYGPRRWDGDRFHVDRHLDRVVEAIRAAAQSRGDTLVGDALAVALSKHDAAARAAARKREQQDGEAARRREEEAVVLGLDAELRALLAIDPEMGMLNAVEFITPDPALRILLYRRCAEDPLTFGLGQDEVRDSRRTQQTGVSPCLNAAPGPRGSGYRGKGDRCLRTVLGRLRQRFANRDRFPADRSQHGFMDQP